MSEYDPHRYDGPPPEFGPPQPDPTADPAVEWQRLDPRMLLVLPVREVIRFLPALIAIVFVGSSSGGAGWQLLALTIPVALGLARYLTTTYRITQARVELRTGLLSRRITSTPLDRVRTIDLTSSLIQRGLGLTTVRIGTGTGGEADRLDLDGLPSERAQAMRRDLLQRARPTVTTPDGPDASFEPQAVDMETDPAPVVSFEPAWLRFAPLTSSGVVIAVAGIGGGAQLLAMFDVPLTLESDAWSIGVPFGLLLTVGVLGFVATVAALAVLGYLVANWNFSLGRSGGSWRVSRGLFTTRETSLDQDRIAGVTLIEGLGLRPLHGARLNAIATGLDRSEATASALVPPAPLQVSCTAAEAILGTSDPLTADLIPHGPAAATRRYVRALVPAVLITAGLVVWMVLDDRLILLPLALVPIAVGLGLAFDRVRSLGHAFVLGRVVSRSGSLARHRTVLGSDHVIGWNFRATWFQRRVGLTTAVATMAGGPQSVTVLDVPDGPAIDLAVETLPEVVSQFLVSLPR
ncbi:PH domain-containing protein [Nocardioides salsibiostraticola]